VPISGTVTAQSESTSSRKASSSGSALSISSTRRSAGVSLVMARRIGRGSRNRSEKKTFPSAAIASAASASPFAARATSPIRPASSCVYRSCFAYSHS
jgi:hypothetical protein